MLPISLDHRCLAFSSKFIWGPGFLSSTRFEFPRFQATHLNSSSFNDIKPLSVNPPHSRTKFFKAMSDDEADPELLELLRAHIMGKPSSDPEPETGVLEGAEYVYDNSIDVALDMWSCKTAANAIYKQMQEKSYSTSSWSEHELHPKAKDESTVNFIFTMDLLNFSFWSELPDENRFAISYKDRTWTGYWSLVAALQRALDEGWSMETETTFDSGG